MHTPLLLLLLLLFGADALFILLDILAQLRGWPDPRWSIESEGGFGERWQYLKEGSAGGLLLHLAMRGVVIHRRACLAWALLFIWILLDDALAVHESFGRRLMPQAPAIGEFLFLFTFGMLVLYGILRTSRRAEASWRYWSRRLEAGLLAFAFFAVGVDLLHALVRSPLWHPILGLVEDGGEMLCMSLMFWVVLCLWRSERPGASAQAEI